MKRQEEVWTRVFPNIPVSKKPIEVRMGKGKGNPEFLHAELNQEEFCLKSMGFQNK